MIELVPGANCNSQIIFCTIDDRVGGSIIYFNTFLL